MESPRITRLGQQGATYPGWQDRLHRGARFLEVSRGRAEASEEMVLPNDERIHGGGLTMEGCEGTGEGKAKTSSSPGTRDIVTAMPAMLCHAGPFAWPQARGAGGASHHLARSPLSPELRLAVMGGFLAVVVSSQGPKPGNWASRIGPRGSPGLP